MFLPKSSLAYVLWLASLYLLLLILLYGIVKIVAFITQRVGLRRRLHQQTLIAAYESPLHLEAAELGYLFDNTFHNNEYLATLACLDQKGVIKLTAKDTVWEIEQLDSPPNAPLTNIESTVYAHIKTTGLASFSEGEAGTEWSEQFTQFEQVVLEGLEDKQLLDHTRSRLHSLENGLSWIIGILLSISTLVIPVTIIQRSVSETGLDQGFRQLDGLVVHLMFIPLYLLAAYLLKYYANLVASTYLQAAGLPIGATSTLHAMWPDIAGYRLFLETVEFDKLRTTTVADDPALSYCIALGFRL